MTNEQETKNNEKVKKTGCVFWNEIMNEDFETVSVEPSEQFTTIYFENIDEAGSFGYIEQVIRFDGQLSYNKYVENRIHISSDLSIRIEKIENIFGGKPSFPNLSIDIQEIADKNFIDTNDEEAIKSLASKLKDEY